MERFKVAWAAWWRLDEMGFGPREILTAEGDLAQQAMGDGIVGLAAEDPRCGWFGLVEAALLKLRPGVDHRWIS